MLAESNQDVDAGQSEATGQARMLSEYLARNSGKHAIQLYTLLTQSHSISPRCSCSPTFDFLRFSSGSTYRQPIVQRTRPCILRGEKVTGELSDHG